MTVSKSIVVTGASRGIGAAIAVELAQRGHVVGCLSRRGAGPEGVEVEAEVGARLIGLAGDVTDPAAMEAAFAGFAARVGRIDGLINNAGIHLEAPAHRQALDEFELVLRTNATAVFSACQKIHPHLKESGGLIVNIGSIFDRMGVRRNAAYCASKAAVAAIGRCLAVEWAAQRIRVLTVAPGYIETDLNRDFLASDRIRDFLAARIPTGGPATPDSVARLIASLVAEDIPFLTGETIYLDGGQSMAL